MFLMVRTAVTKMMKINLTEICSGILSMSCKEAEGIFYNICSVMHTHENYHWPSYFEKVTCFVMSKHDHMGKRKK